MIKRLLIIIALLTAGFSAMAEAPDMEAIRKATTDPASELNYTRLLDMFMSNDTVMTDKEYEYFYYGTMFQEDYNPYRESPYKDEAKNLEHLYLKQEHLTGKEKKEIETLSLKAIQDNPLDLRQLMYRVYVLEQNRKVNLAKIWRRKLDKILMTIARSGDGTKPETAWVVVYPRHEFEFFNLSGGSVTNQQFQPPYFDKLTVSNKNGNETQDYYFNLHTMLEQYYLKHPEER
ncbi:MAG: DUF4919 domain-containing protein [Bacteroidales bacterium]|nr:DUF4919 domain-containing protein [Bacteroidales bacterium]MDY2917278.1 DUF4919 domain-containing protein [Muribaculaceae bacterium]